MSHLAPLGDIDVSIVIVNWNAKDYLRICLKSIADETPNLNVEVFVVDNASADGSAEMVREEFPGVRLIANADNKGFAAANNQGMRQSRGRYVLLLNPDTVILENAIEKSVAFADRTPRAGVVGCRVLETMDRAQRTGFRFPGPLNTFWTMSGLTSAFPGSRVFSGHLYAGWDRDSERRLEVVSGMYMLVRRQAIEEVGLMDEAYFVYAEEADWCFRFWKAGWECVFTPEARILHTEGGSKSTAKDAVRMYVQKQKSLQIFQRKNLGRLPWLAAKAVYIATLSVRVVGLSARRLLRGGERERLKVAMAVAALKYHLFRVDPTVSS